MNEDNEKDYSELSIVTEQGMFGELGLEDPNVKNVENKKINRENNKVKSNKNALPNIIGMS